VSVKKIGHLMLTRDAGRKIISGKVTRQKVRKRVGGGIKNYFNR
jgi:hypothetical protein